MNSKQIFKSFKNMVHLKIILNMKGELCQM